MTLHMLVQARRARGWLLALLCVAALQPGTNSTYSMFVPPSTSFPPRHADPVQEHQHLCTVATAKTACARPASTSSTTAEQGSVGLQDGSSELKDVTTRAACKGTDPDDGERVMAHGNTTSMPPHATSSKQHANNRNSLRANCNLGPLSERKPHLFRSARENNTSATPRTGGSFEVVGEREKHGRTLWIKRFCDLIAFKQRHGKCRVPTQADTMHVTDFGGICLNTKDRLSMRRAKEKHMQKRFGRHMVLGKWVAKQRHRMKKGVHALHCVCVHV